VDDAAVVSALVLSNPGFLFQKQQL
jgi:hypothetical protein